MPQNKYETALKQCNACAVDKGLTGCYECKNNLWSAQPCVLSYELATQDIKNVEYRLTEIQRHCEALQSLGGTEELQKGIEASLKEYYGYEVTLAELTEKAEGYVKLLKERIAVCRSDS